MRQTSHYEFTGQKGRGHVPLAELLDYLHLATLLTINTKYILRPLAISWLSKSYPDCRASVRTLSAMASHVVVIDSTAHRITVKTAPGKYLSDVLDEACGKLGLNPSLYGLK